MAESCGSLRPVPPAKRRPNYKWCQHCSQLVAERTYRSHRGLSNGIVHPEAECTRDAQVSIKDHLKPLPIVEN